MEEALKSQVGSQVWRARWAPRCGGPGGLPGVKMGAQEVKVKAKGLVTFWELRTYPKFRVLVQDSALPLTTVGLRSPLSNKVRLHVMVLQMSPLIKGHPHSPPTYSFSPQTSSPASPFPITLLEPCCLLGL